jgi:hypothetical protein
LPSVFVEDYGKYGAILAHIDLCTYGASRRSKTYGKLISSARFFKFLSYHIVLDLISIDLRVVFE